MSFAGDLERFRAKTMARVNLVVRKIIVDVTTSVVMKSPVGDAAYWVSKPPKGYTGGRFRANWRFGTGSAPGGTSEAIDKSGGLTINSVASAIPAEPAGDIHFIVNNLPYGKRLEEGYSRQAPHGMVGLTVIEFNSIVRGAAA
jgi:hypothetical protein